MGHIDLSPYDAIADTVASSATFNNLLSALQTLLNGDLDDTNVAAGAAIAISKLAGYPSDGTKSLLGDGTWGRARTVSAFSGGPPVSPADGDVWVATGVDGIGTRWAFQYNAGSGSSFKWEFVGGPPITGGQGSNNAVINTLTQVGATGYYYSNTMKVTVGRPGDYLVSGMADLSLNGGGSGSGSVSVFDNAALVGGAMGVALVTGSGTDYTCPVDAVLTGAAAADTVGIAVSSSASGTYKVGATFVKITPRRVS